MPQLAPIRSWLQLVRIANLPTAISNVLAGAMLAGSSWAAFDSGLVGVLVAIAASACFYCGGMILNDAHDAEIDAVERPGRPIPAGAISRLSAFLGGYGCLAIGLLITLAISCFGDQHRPLFVSPFEVGLLLASAISLYDGLLKKTWLAPWLMGACRGLNIVLGASVALAWAMPDEHSVVLTSRVFYYALLIGLMIVGITTIGRREAKARQSRLWLAAGSVAILLALVGIGSLLTLAPKSALQFRGPSSSVYLAMIGLIALPILLRLISAVFAPGPQTVQRAVITSLNSLILLDATACYLARPDQPIAAAMVASLTLAVVGLKRWSQQT